MEWNRGWNKIKYTYKRYRYALLLEINIQRRFSFNFYAASHSLHIWKKFWLDIDIIKAEAMTRERESEREREGSLKQISSMFSQMFQTWR